MQMRQRDVAAPDAKYTKELADAKAENDALCVMMLSLVVVCCIIKAAPAGPVREATTASGVDNSLPPTGDTGLDYFTLRERPITMQTIWRTQKYINEQCR